MKKLIIGTQIGFMVGDIISFYILEFDILHIITTHGLLTLGYATLLTQMYFNKR